jgi:hypothetical protein
MELENKSIKEEVQKYTGAIIAQHERLMRRDKELVNEQWEFKNGLSYSHPEMTGEEIQRAYEKYCNDDPERKQIIDEILKIEDILARAIEKGGFEK